jgi:hypothetical protein
MHALLIVVVIAGFVALIAGGLLSVLRDLTLRFSQPLALMLEGPEEHEGSADRDSVARSWGGE